MQNILLIEDEENLNRGISLKLKKEGYTVFSASTVTGLDVCNTLRKKSDVLFLFLTALDTEVDMITGYEMGADDYITKPFSMSVLISKINAILKRNARSLDTVIHSGELTFFLDEKRVTKGDTPLSITPTDWKLLTVFIENPAA